MTFINRKIDCYVAGFSKPLQVYTVHCRLSLSEFEAPVVCLMYSILRFDWRTHVHQIPCHFQWLLISTAFNIFLFQFQIGVCCLIRRYSSFSFWSAHIAGYLIRKIYLVYIFNNICWAQQYFHTLNQGRIMSYCASGTFSLWRLSLFYTIMYFYKLNFYKKYF